MKYQITLEDYQCAQRLHIKPRPLFSALLVLVLFFWVTALAILIRTAVSTGQWEMPGIVGVGLGYIVIHSLIYRPYKIRLLYRQTKAFHDEIEITVHDDIVEFSSQRGSNRLPFAHILKIREDDRIMLLYHADNLFQMVPKTTLEGAQITASIRDRFAAMKG